MAKQKSKGCQLTQKRIRNDNKLAWKNPPFMGKTINATVL